MNKCFFFFCFAFFAFHSFAFAKQNTLPDPLYYSSPVLDSSKLEIEQKKIDNRTINEKLKPFLKLIGNEDYQVLYIAGKNLYDDFIKDTTFPSNIKVVPYVDNLNALMKSAYLIITRAGASTISEILALNIPSILVPSPYVANNHQYYNALDLVNLGVAELIEEKNLKADVLQIAINELINNPIKYEEMVHKLKNIKTTSSSELIYNEAKDLLK